MTESPNSAHPAEWFGHPRQLARLFTTEMWERFGYYGLRALLTLYLTQHFMFGDRQATSLYGGYTALVYLTPLIGGYLADQILGSKRAVKFGAIIMSLGYLVLCFGGPTAQPFATIDGQRYAVSIERSGAVEERFVIVDRHKQLIRGNDDGSVALIENGQVVRTVAKDRFTADAERSPFYVTVLLIGLSMVSIGNGFFKPNISTMVGELYEAGDRRRDAGFTIFYMGINMGSLFSQLLCPLLAVLFDWWAGFGLAAVGMLISWSLIQFDGGRLAGFGEPPARLRNDRRQWWIYAGALAFVPVFYLLYVNLMAAPAPPAGAGIAGYVLSLPLMGKLLFGAFLIGVPAILVWSFRVGSRQEFQMMLAAMVLILFNVVFWTLFEQAGSSLTLFADRNTDLSVFGLFEITAGQTQFFNAAFIVLLAPFMSVLWSWLAKRGMEPGIPVKFGIALIGVALGFLLLVWGAGHADGGFQVGLWWLAGLYLIHSFAELCISPVGLSMVTKLSITRIVGLMMGVWFLSVSVAQYVAGVIAQLASVDTIGGQVTNLKVSLDNYIAVFTLISEWAIGLGVLLLLLSWPLGRWMHGVK